MEDVLDIQQFVDRASKPQARAQQQQEEQKAAEPPPPFNSVKAPTFPRVMDCQISYVDPDTGDACNVTVQSKVPGFAEKLQISRIEAQLCGPGVSFESLPPEKAAWIRALARMQVQLVSPPKGVTRYLSENSRALFELNQVLEIHEFAFFRPSATASGATQSVTDLVVTSPLDRWMEGASGSAGR